MRPLIVSGLHLSCREGTFENGGQSYVDDYNLITRPQGQGQDQSTSPEGWLTLGSDKRVNTLSYDKQLPWTGAKDSLMLSREASNVICIPSKI